MNDRVSAFAKTCTLWRLGPVNLLRVATYRTLLKSGFYARALPIRAPLAGPFFDWESASHTPSAPAIADAAAWSALADRVIHGELPVFSHRWVNAGFPPRWHRSVLTQVDAPQPHPHWALISDFALPGGDVKGYWEPARFDGLLILVLGWLCTKREDLRQGIEQWLAGWCSANPANAGLQWKCGQETGIRLLHTLLAAELLQRWGGVGPTPALLQFVAQHCQRIAPTMLYAVGQDNNHGTSEAAALFVAGAFLKSARSPELARQGRKWLSGGRRWLENRVGKLVMPDGSFSQHSVNYHRMMLDTCCLAETFRRWYGEAPWSARMVQRCGAATHWLTALTDPRTGDAPNLGANDGSRLFVLHQQPYRDHRPSLHWAANSFLGRTVCPAGPHDEPLAWLGLNTTHDDEPSAVPGCGRLFPDGGYAKLERGSAWALLRLPVFRFRPSHADALHLDLWLDGEPVLRDAGSYSYNAEPHWLGYFSGTASHNTVQFDDRDQMPRLSRFLFGHWLRCRDLEFDAAAGRVAASYRDHFGASHRREVQLAPGRCVVTDTVSGFARSAVLRWRLMPSAWILTPQGVSNGTVKIAILSESSFSRLELVEGQESTHYAHMTSLPVLEVEVTSPTTLVTELTWRA